MALNTCLPLYEQLKEDFPEVRAVNAMYTHGLVAIISVEARTGGLGKLVAMRAITTPHGRGYCKFVIVVDHTVDPFDLPQVMWALSTKVNPLHDLVMLPRMNMVPLDPSADPPRPQLTCDHRCDDSASPRCAIRGRRPGGHALAGGGSVA